MQDPWKRLEDEFGAFAAAGLRATLWWRDDDAIEVTAPLERLVALADEFVIPAGLAVIPAGATKLLGDYLADRPRLAALQHGYAHQDRGHMNSPAPGRPEKSRLKKSEFGNRRTRENVAADLRRGRARLLAAIPTALPVFVPPWNRIAEDFVALLPEAGLFGLSTFQARPRTQRAPGVVQVNTHADVTDWAGGRVFAGEAAVLGRIVAHLEAKRLGRADLEEPTGLLTHHLVHDAATWAFLERLFGFTRAHEVVDWAHCEAIFASDQAQQPETD